MKMTLEISDEMAVIDGVICRIWNGFADNGVPVRVYVHRVAVPIELPQCSFKEKLFEMAAPQKEDIVFEDEVIKVE
jgi:hypothetical protein